MPSVEIDFDFDEVLPTVRAAHSRANIDDAEEAISVACVELLAKGTPLTAANVVTRARSRLRDRFKRRETGNFSLDAAAEDTVDSAPRELAVDESDFDSHMRLREIVDNPITRAKLELLQRGGAARITARGMKHPGAKYSDDVVKRSWALRAEGLTYPAIAESLQAPRETVEAWCRRESRSAGSGAGWSPSLVLLSMKVFAEEEGRRPTAQDVMTDARLPALSTIERHFGAWSAALEAFGVPVAEQGQARYWTDARIIDSHG